jgi:hypothetical protein
VTLKTHDLSVLAFAKDFTLWQYRTQDTRLPDGYFDRADGLLASGDMILANLGSGTDAQVGIFLVTANAGGAVQVEDLSPARHGS